MNYFLVTYDLYSPGQKYNDLIAEIEKAPTSAWAKIMLSCYIVGTSESASRLSDRLRKHLDDNDTILVIKICNNYQGWLTQEIHDWIKNHVPDC
jgi:hypothetical protein